MSVIQRCPSCGTTQATGGECTTCHEAQVRYFCTDHDPGMWSIGPTCAECAARSAPPARPAVSHPRTRRAAPRRPRPIGERILDPRTRPAPREIVLGVDVLARRDPDSVGRAGGWLMQLILRLALIAVVLGVGIVVVIYLVARSLS